MGDYCIQYIIFVLCFAKADGETVGFFVAEMFDSAVFCFYDLGIASENGGSKMVKRRITSADIAAFREELILTEKGEDAETKSVCEELAAAIRYRDPMSSAVLAVLEKELAACDKAVTDKDNASAKTLCQKALLLLSERNKKRKALK